MYLCVLNVEYIFEKVFFFIGPGGFHFLTYGEFFLKGPHPGCILNDSEYSQGGVSSLKENSD